MTIAKLEWDDINFIKSLKTEDATGIQIREIDGVKKYILTFDLETINAEREELYKQAIQAMREFNSTPTVSYFEFSREPDVCCEPAKAPAKPEPWYRRLLNWLRIY